jgi:hypothetical protein
VVIGRESSPLTKPVPTYLMPEVMSSRWRMVICEKRVMLCHPGR